MAANFEEIAKQFVEFYYNSFDKDRKSIAGLYRENSMLTFESASVLGSPSITEKLAGLPFQAVKHQVATLDAQPTPNDGVLVLVTGALLVDEEQRPMNFSQVFQLLKDGNGSYFIYNDIFKLIFG